MISLLFFVLFSASAFEVAPANTGQYYLAVFASDSPVTAVIGGEVVLSEESPSGLFALLYIDYESLFITPAPTDVRLIPVDHSAPARFTTKASRRYGFAVIEPSVEAECKYLSPVSRQLLPFSEGDLLPLAVAYHRVYILCGDRTVYFSDPDELHFPHLPVFLVEPIFIRLPLESRPVLVGFPRVFPAPSEDTVFDISISVSGGGTIVSAARLRPGEFYTIDPAPLSYSVHYQLRLDRDLTELAYGYFSIGPEDTQSESEFDYADHTIPQKKSLDPIPYTRVQLEPGQVLPRFPDSPGAFVVAEPIDLSAGLESQNWAVVINGVAFVPNNGSRRHVFVAQFGIDYRVAFVSSQASTVPVILSAPPSGIIRQLHPAVRGCDGAVLYPVWTNVGYSRPRPDAILTEDGHFYQLEKGNIVDGCDDQVDIYAPIPSPPPILIASISLARYWKVGLSESELCDQMAQIDVEVGPVYSSPLFIEWQGEIMRLSESGRIQIKARLPLPEISSIRVYTDGGMRYLARAEVILNKAAGAKSPIDFSHPHPIVLVPYRSVTSPGRLVIAANVTNYRGAAVDMNALHPGVYLSTATHAFPAEHVTCITRELVVVPLASMPYASIDARVSSTTAVCPSDVRGALTPFQIGVPPSANLVLWSEDTGTARPLDTSDARVVTATGTYQLLNTATGEYSAPIVFSPAPYTAAADFVFSLVPRKNKRNPADPFEPDHDLQFKYPRGVRASIWLVACEPFGGDAFVCPTEQEMFLHLEDGLLLLLGLPFVAKITLEIEIGGVCRFEKTGHLLPLSDALPLEISRIECATDCRGMVSAIPFYVDPYSSSRGSLTRAPTLPGVVYESRLDGRLVNRAPSIWAPEPAAREYTVEFTMTRGHRSIVKSQVCQADPAPVFRPRIDLPVFCPDTADARVVFDDLNFKGTVSLSDCDSGSIIETKTTSEVISRGFAGLEAGPKCFNYTAESWSGRRCEGAHRVDIAQKMHYHVNARAVARPARTGAEVEIRPGGEFDLLTGDMLRKVSDRVYVDDNDGAGTTRVTGLPNGGGVEILIPYPETYSHITRDFCPEPLILSVDRLADDIVREKKRQDYEAVQEQCVVDPPIQRVRVEDPVLISWQTTFGQIPPNFKDIMQSIIVNRTENSILMAYEHQSGCTLMVEWTTTTGTERKRRSEDRIASKKYQGTLSQIECKVTRPLSCPLCFDAEITLSTNALSPVFYVWTSGAARITDSPVLSGLPAGSYMATAIERGGTVDDSVSCVAHIAFEGPVARIEKIETTTAKGCPGGAYFDATIKTSRPVPLYAVIDKETDDVSPVESCADPRFTAESKFRLAVDKIFRAYICDGAEVRENALSFLNYTGPKPAPLEVAFAEGQFQCQSWVGTLLTNPSLPENGFETLTTVVVQDDRECPAFVDVPPGVPILSADRAMVIQAMTVSELEPDCVINSTQTVTEAVDEIIWCASQERQITGNGAPVIDVPVVLPSRATLDMQFLQFSAGLAFGRDTIAFLLDVDFLAGTTNVSAAIATFSYGDWAAPAALEIGDTAGIQAQQQQINVQYAPVRDRLTINIAPGQKELALVLAYFDAPVVSVTANRTTMLQLLTVNANEIELRLPRESSKIVWLSTNGGSRIDVLTIFLPGGNVSGANGTWTSSNATIRVACEYLLDYPEIVLTARGGYGGPVFVDREMCIDFGGAASNSQSQSRSQPVYEQVGFPEEITFMFVGIMIVVVIAGVSIAFAFFGL